MAPTWKVNMRTLTLLTILLIALAAILPQPAVAGPFYGGVNLGYTGGLGIHFTGSFMEFTRDLPLSARLTLGYNSASPGDPYAARRIFINDNTNGDPEKSAHTWQFRFDLMFPAFKLGLSAAGLRGGLCPRAGSERAHPQLGGAHCHNDA